MYPLMYPLMGVNKYIRWLYPMAVDVDVSDGCR
jgi:hypothetical protein